MMGGLTEYGEFSSASELIARCVEKVNSTYNLNVIAKSSLVPFSYDYMELAYTGSNLTQVIFKSSGVTVATLTLAYTGSQLDSVTKT